MLKAMERFGVFFGIFLSVVNGQTTSCTSPYSCAEYDISTTGFWQCAAGYSCVKASISVEQDIYCQGSFSCLNATLIEGDKSANCHGTYSCAFAKLIKSINLLGLYGALSGYYGTFIAGTSITCGGCRSCAYGNFTHSTTFYVYGALSTQNSILQSGDSSVDYQFYASEAGYGATILCSGTCGISCDGSGCNNLNLTCADGGGSCTFSKTCIYSEKNQVCSDTYGYDLDLLYNLIDFEIPSLADTDFTTFENSRDLCKLNDTKVTVCDSQSDCGNMDNWDINGTLCCTGLYSCQRNSNVSLSNDNEYNIAMRCDSSFACGYGDGSVTGSNGGSIYYATTNTNYAGTEIVSTNGIGDIIVEGSQGFQSSDGARITNVNNVYCLSYYGCRYVSISDINGALYGAGRESLSSTTISNIGQNVYCIAMSSCSQSTISSLGVNSSLIGTGYQTLYQSTISNVDQYVIGMGYQALKGSVLTNVTKVIVSGYQVLQGSTIDGISRLNVLDDAFSDTLSSCVIISNVKDDSKLFIAYINGTTSGYYDIYCNATDTCKIECQSSSACTYLRLHCAGQCYVSCGETNNNGNDCPYSGDYYNWTYTNAPTYMPSEIPTSDPTHKPSAQPTTQPSSEPSSQPSNDPTYHPSHGPTYQPTQQPNNETSYSPSSQPSVYPASDPTIVPTNDPTVNPTESAGSSGDDAFEKRPSVFGFVVVFVCLIFLSFSVV